MEKRKLKFIDLFAGLGGFHKALHNLGHECVFASEIDITLQETYRKNWGKDINIQGDIRKIVANDIESIPDHDILCAGFPCQPFSKAGKQLGREDERGTLFDEIIKILELKKPQYFILENVRFIAKHNNEETLKAMKSEFARLGYSVDHRDYSPHDFGIPQHRQRIFIVGSLKGLDHFSFDKIDKKKKAVIEINKFIDKHPIDAKKLSPENEKCLRLWQDLIDCLPTEVKIPGFPIWGMEFGATYPFEGVYPQQLSESELSEFKGNFGCSLKGLTKEQQLAKLPSYARVNSPFPSWKVGYIQKSRNFYDDNKKDINKAVSQIAKLPSQSWQKLEWNVGDGNRNLFDYILQFRASGIRVKKPDVFPSLVCTTTQVPIVAWENRYLTSKEALKLQSLSGLELPPNENAAFRALGNAVNSQIVTMIAEHLLSDIVPKSASKKKLLFSQIPSQYGNSR